MEEPSGIQSLDPETEFLASKRETGDDWELLKENVRPLKRGRNVQLLNQALRSHTNNYLRKALLHKRRRMIELIDEYKGDDPLEPWIECIKWVQESFPPGGECSGLVLIYEQCLRTFWHSERYKEDLRFLKLWLEYAEHCADAEVIYSFLSANEIGKTHAEYYVAHALHLESKSKFKAANEIFNLGISRDAQPLEKLRDAYQKFLARSMRRSKVNDEEDAKENELPARSFGTVLSNVENRRQKTGSNFSIAGKMLKTNATQRTQLSIYTDTTDVTLGDHQANNSRVDIGPWNSLGTRADRNKENSARPGKWTSHKIRQRPLARSAVPTSAAAIEVFVDEECAETLEKKEVGRLETLTLPLSQVDDRDIKKETQLLRNNPLRNFPPNSLPR